VLPLDCDLEELSEGDLVHLETPVNPTGCSFNIQHFAERAHARGAYLSVDSTFAPPPLQDPFKHDADIVMHSGTKFIGGHSDFRFGVLAIKKQEWAQRLFMDRSHLGSTMNGFDSFLGMRSIRTLDLRVLQQSRSAGVIVNALHSALTGEPSGLITPEDAEAIRVVVKEVHHASPQAGDYEAWLKNQMPIGFGSMFLLTLRSPHLAKKLPSKLALFHHATSLGSVESLIEWRTMSDPTVEKDLLRISIGVEDHRDLLNDLIGGFRAVLGEQTPHDS
jgi:cystathionine beta-lyase/cystathionine gamma-synthase